MQTKHQTKQKTDLGLKIVVAMSMISLVFMAAGFFVIGINASQELNENLVINFNPMPDEISAEIITQEIVLNHSK